MFFVHTEICIVVSKSRETDSIMSFALIHGIGWAIMTYFTMICVIFFLLIFLAGGDSHAELCCVSQESMQFKMII